MSNKTVLGVIFGGAVFYWAYQKYIFSNAVSFKIGNVSLDGSFFNPTINLELIITNPTDITTTISNIAATAYSNNTLKISDVFYNQQTEIKANSQVTVPLVLFPSVTGVINSIKELVATKKGSFQLKGSASIDGINLPFNLNYSL
jgi:LEA14-like dessication related protein